MVTGSRSITNTLYAATSPDLVVGHAALNANAQYNCVIMHISNSTGRKSVGAPLWMYTSSETCCWYNLLVVLVLVITALVGWCSGYWSNTAIDLPH